MTDTFEVVPSGAVLAAEVVGIDLGRIDDETFRAIRRAWLEHQVLLFRDQHLSDAQLIAFSLRFGKLDLAPSAGDLVVWDNRCTMHRRNAFDPGSRRIMHRTQIKA